jgi:hypothetical protein
LSSLYSCRLNAALILDLYSNINVAGGVATFLGACNGPEPASPNRLAADGVPKPLHRIESAAEAIIDLVPTDNWRGVAEKVTAICMYNFAAVIAW